MDNGITLVSKFPTKTWGAMHAQTVDTRPLYLLPRGLGMRLAQLVNNNTRTFFRCCLYRCKTWRTHTTGMGERIVGERMGEHVCHFLSASDPTHKATDCQTVNDGHQSCSGVHTQSSSWTLKAFTDYINEEQSVVQQKMTVKCT